MKMLKQFGKRILVVLLIVSWIFPLVRVDASTTEMDDSDVFMETETVNEFSEASDSVELEGETQDVEEYATVEAVQSGPVEDDILAEEKVSADVFEEADAVNEDTLEDDANIENLAEMEDVSVISDDVPEGTLLEEQGVPVTMSDGGLEIGDEFIDGKFKYRIIAEGEVEISPTTYLPDGNPTVTDVIIPQTVTYEGENYLVTQIGWRAFRYYGHLENVVMPNSITTIRQFAFLGCSELKNIYISDSLTNIESYAFEGCSSLTNIDLPDGITDIGASAFKDCSSLTSIDLPDNLNGIEWDIFYNCSSLKSVNIPDGVTFIGPNAFRECSNLSEIIIPGSVTYIGSGAFQDCSYLTQVVISEGVTKIYSDAFKGCNSLASVDIPKGMQEISSSVFDCDLKLIRFKGNVPTDCAYDIFGRVGRKITAFYPINNVTWTENVRHNISLHANIIWIPWDSITGEVFTPDGSNPSGSVPSDATFYFSDDTKYCVYDDEMFAYFSGSFDAVQKGNVSEEADAIVWESSDPLVADIDHVLYMPDTGNIYSGDNAYTSAMFSLTMNCYKPGVVTITGTSADGRMAKATLVIEPKLIAGESTSIIGSSNVMLCKVELPDKTDEQLSFLKTFFESLEVNIVKGTKLDLKPFSQSGDDFVGLYAQVDADSVSGRIAIKVTSPGGQAVQMDVLVSGDISENTVVYYRGDKRDSWTFDYTLDSCLEKNSAEYNPDLSHMLVALANSAYHKEGLDFTLLEDADSGTFPSNPLTITESLRNLGFDAEYGDVREFNYGSNYGIDKSKVGFTLATKKMSDGTTLISIVVRGSYNVSDWINDFNFMNLGVGLHEGFDFAANEIIQELNKFKNEKSISGNKVKYVITGHSRGAAVSNLVAKKLIDSGVSSNNVYDYNFACPDTGRDFAINWNSNGKYNSLYNINNVRDVIGVIPGYLCTKSSVINAFLFEQSSIFWGKYGRTYFFAENWDSVIGSYIGNPMVQHSSQTYLDYLINNKPSIDSFKSWEQARATLAANVLEDAAKISSPFGWIFAVLCPVDFEIISKDGVKFVEVVNGQPQYYEESFGDVVIITDEDHSLVYLNGRNSYFVKYTGSGTGEMTYCVSDAILGSEYGKEIMYANVPISPGKTMVSILNNDEQSDKVTLVLFDEELNPVKQIDSNGAEQELSDELKEEYSNLPLGKKNNSSGTVDSGNTGQNNGVGSGSNTGSNNTTNNNTTVNVNANTNVNTNADTSNTANTAGTSILARDSVPNTGDSLSTKILLSIISMLMLGMVIVRINFNNKFQQ